jgi:hypothetical protein
MPNTIVPQTRSIDPAGMASIVVPEDFLDLLDPPPSGLDRRLGYPGSSRFVLFRDDAVTGLMWSDGRQRGRCADVRGRSAATIFAREVVPLARQYRLGLSESRAVSSNLKCGFVLVVDRGWGWVYFAPRLAAEQFLAQQQQENQG